MVTAVQSPAKLKTLDDVDQALHELSYLEHERDRRKALCQQELDALKTRQADRFVLQIDAELIPLEERYQAVHALLMAWCDKQLVAHLPEDKKSLDLPHGQIGLRAQPMKVECDEGIKPEDVLDKLDRKVGFRQYISDLLDKIFGKCVVGWFVSFESKLSFSSITKALKEHRVTEKDLKGLGLVVREPADATFIKPARYQVDVNAST